MALISTDFVRRLGSSKFNYWFGYVANLMLVAWLVSHAWVGGTLSMSWSRFVTYALMGILSWTLSEYLLHRYLYHVWPSALSVGHDLHHKDPKALIGVPWWFSSLIIVGVYLALDAAFDAAAVGVIFGFNWLGYIGYCVMHHGSHHWSMRSPYFRHMKRNHLVHHAYPAYNWGFTTSLWDHIFRTAFPAEKVAQQQARERGAMARRQHAA